MLIAFMCLQLSLKADERDVYEFFSKAGKVGMTLFNNETDDSL